MKKYKDLLEQVSKKTADLSVAQLREDYIQEKIFNVGDIVLVKENNSQAEIISRGPNYVTLLKEGKTFKKWITDLQELSSKSGGILDRYINNVSDNSQKNDLDPSKRTKKHKFNLAFNKLHVQGLVKVPAKRVAENVEYLGYVTKNFNSELSDIFVQITEDTQDPYAILNLIQGLDNLQSDFEVESSNFNQYKTDFDRTIRYLNKFNLSFGLIEEAEDKLLEYSISENINFSAADKMKVAKIIAATAEVSDVSGDCVEIVERSAKQFKSGRHTPEAWKLFGAMLNKATEAGIKWNKDIFNKSIHRIMGI